MKILTNVIDLGVGGSKKVPTIYARKVLNDQ